MDSMKTFAEVEFQKDLVSSLLKQSFVDTPDEDYEEFTDLVLGKIHLMNDMRATIEREAGDTLEEASSKYETSKEHVIDAYLYFTLIVENVFMTRKLIEIANNMDDDG